ncbi:hypothetical protein [Nocardia tengchongensis]|uniref:hypothetical protein n=1 Tax=Nocardia tengchongensis TaxID=2055889 RepID=UPI0036CBED16
MYGEHYDPVLLDDLTSHPHVVEILDLLSESGCNAALLARIIRAPSPDLASTLRVIAANGLLTTSDPGSWDEPLAHSGPIRLNDRGEAVAQVLSDPSMSRTEHDGRRTVLRGLFRRSKLV